MRKEILVPGLLAALVWLGTGEQAAGQAEQEGGEAQVSTIEASALEGYDAYPPAVKALVDRALALTRRNLGYRYGSAHPDAGGMDCSGTIHYLLKSSGIPDVPRQANEMYAWVWRQTQLYPVNSRKPDSFEFDALAPGDLLFWTGTYDVERDPPITHVMLYLGKLKADGRRVMFGASSGRRFEGKSRHGVSVFDLEMPRAGSEARFVGYGKIPDLEAAAPKGQASGGL